MLSYKFDIDQKYSDLFINESREFQWVVRTAYNIWRTVAHRYQNKLITKEEYNNQRKGSYIEQSIKDSGLIKYLDASFVKMAVNEAKNKRNLEKVIFGDVVSFNKLKNGNKSPEVKQKWIDSRTYGMFIRGSSSDSGNRKAKLDIENSGLYVWVNAKNKIFIPIQMTTRQKQVLLQIQNKSKTKKSYFNIRINKNSIDIVFSLEELIKTKQPKKIKGRILAIDSNPDELGIVVYDQKSNKILHKTIIDVAKVNRINGDNPISTNKRHYEKFNIGKKIVNIAKSFHCSFIAVEDLTIKSKDHSKGIRFNRIVNNTWNRGIYDQAITKWARIENIDIIKVYAGYSSLVGCLQNPDEFDSIAAAIEVAKRGIKAIDEYEFIMWKEVLLDDLELPEKCKSAIIINALTRGITNLSELLTYLRDEKIEYRMRMDRSKVKSNWYKSNKSLIKII